MRKLEPASLQLQIRKMQTSDLDAVMQIQRASFKNPWSLDLFRRELSHDWSTILLGELPGPQGLKLVGFLIYWLVHDELHILNVATEAEHRRQGIARILLSETLLRAREHKCSLATLEVRRSNQAAVDLYQAFGFRPVGIRPNYYVEEKEDAIVMVLDL